MQRVKCIAQTDYDISSIFLCLYSNILNLFKLSCLCICIFFILCSYKCLMLSFSDLALSIYLSSTFLCTVFCILDLNFLCNLSLFNYLLCFFCSRKA